MTIASTVTKKIYDADGVTRDWPITMETSGISSSEIKVYLVDEDGVSTLVTANYDVDLTALSVEYPTVVSGLDPIASPNKILLVRELALTQPTDYKNQGDVPAETIEEGLDRLTEVAQQLQEQVDRSVKSDISENSGLDYDDFVAVKADCDAAQAAAEAAQGLAEDAQASAEAVLTDAGFVAVAADLIGDDNIGTVADSISDVNDVADNVIAIAAVNANETNINAVNSNKTNIDAVAGNSTNINAVAGNSTNINAVNANKTNIDKVAAIDSDVSAVADIDGDITTCADNIDDISTVADNIGTIGDKISGDGTVNPTNLLSNGDFEAWSAGTSAAPDGWGISGASASVAREGTIIKSGVYSAKLTRAGADASLYNLNYATPDKGLTYYQGRTLTFSCWVYATVASRARIVINDGATLSYSAYHTGDSTWQLLSVTKAMSGAATRVQSFGLVDTGDTSAYFDGAMCVEGESAFAFSPKPVAYSDARFYMGTLTRDMTASGGDVAYTSVGFRPKAIIFTAAIGNTGIGTYCGMSDGTTHGSVYNVKYNAAGDNTPTTYCIMGREDATKFQGAVVKTFDADGFTLTWTKNDSPSAGNLEVKYLALR